MYIEVEFKGFFYLFSNLKSKLISFYAGTKNRNKFFEWRKMLLTY